MEQKVKKREWVKNAAIIFLAVMLLLTFFSNTILNRTLPEVATTYIESGTIDSKVRISGTVAARENYDLTLEQSRRVESVPVRVGQTVCVGDVILVLEESESEELTNARNTLRSAELAYQRKIAGMNTADYAAEQRAIDKAAEALEEAKKAYEPYAATNEEMAAARAKADFDLLTCTPEERALARAESDLALAQAEYAPYEMTSEERIALSKDVEEKKAAVTDCEKKVSDCQANVDAAQTGVNNSSDGTWGGGGNSSQLIIVNERKAEMEQAKNALQAAMLAYKTEYEALVEAAKTEIALARGIAVDDLTAEVYAIYRDYYEEKVYDEWTAESATPEQKATAANYKKVKDAETAAADAESAYNSALASYNDSDSYDTGYSTYKGKTHSYWLKELETAQTALKDAQTLLKDANTALEQAQAKLDNHKTERESLEAAEEAVLNAQIALDAKRSEKLKAIEACETDLMDKQFALGELQKNDYRTAAADAIDLQELSDNIADAKALVEKLENDVDAGATEITSRVNGTVQTISVSAGHKANAGDILLSIEVTDMGYSLTTTISAEQAQLLHVGDTAEVGNFYWGSQTTAEIDSIRPDPKDPRTSRMVVFNLNGDVTAGSKLDFSIGEKNATYDYVVPNSAVRSDAKGSFILVITAKNSPLGNRYFAERVDVEVIAKDDYHSALKGAALNSMDSVITTTGKNAPVAPGDQVRLSDSND